MIKRLLYYLYIFILFNISHTLYAEKTNSVRYFPEFESEENVSLNSELNTEETETTTGTTTTEAEYVDAVIDDIVTEGKSINSLSKESLYNLPVGIYDDANNPNYVVAIDSANIYSDYASFNAYLQVKIPLGGKILRFKSEDIRFTFENGIEGDFKLQLMDTDSISISKGIKLIIKEGTSATWDCGGFKEINLIGYLKFSGDTFIRVNSKGVETGSEMTVPINMVIASFNDFFMEFAMPTFKIKGLGEVFFEFNQVCLDMSDTSNPDKIFFPTDYPIEYSSDTEDLWQGLYIKQATIAFTKLSRKDSVPILISANDLLWDDYGLTCLVEGENIMTLDEGGIATWSFSMDYFQLEIVAGQFKMASFDGEILPDGFKENTPMQYEAYFDVDGNYIFGVSPEKDLKFDLLMATVNLESNSCITVVYEDGSFQPSATLYGDISLACNESSNNENDDGGGFLTTASIKFEGMHIATVTPKFSIENIEYSGAESSSLSGFPITFSDFAFESKDGFAYMTFTTTVNLKSSSEEGFGGSTNMSVVADLDEWQFHKVEVNSIHVEFTKPNAFSIIGDIWFIRGDDDYGDGFSGQLVASFGKFADLEANAMFGNVNGYRYFAVDAMMTFTNGVPAGPLTLYGLAGGVSYHMTKAKTVSTDPEFAQFLSGMTYTPDISSDLGIMAGVQFGMGDKTMLQAEVKFSIIFSSGGGIQQVTFNGKGSVMSEALEATSASMQSMAGTLASGGEATSSSSKTPPISFTMYMLMDFENDVFHAENEIFVNIGGVLTGVGSNNRAGWMVLHIEDAEWYLHMGTPSDPIGLNFVGMAETNSYFMVGHNIPADMPMHPKVLEYLDMSASDFESNRDESELVSGSGVAFGTSFDCSTGDLTFLTFYANFELGFGFDIMLLRYPDIYYCEGESQPMGIEHWYAKGQAYVYFAGEIGIQVKLFLKSKKFTILKLQCAAAVVAEGPNPFWAMGVVGGNYNILGGLVKGSCKFEVEIGDRCELAVSQSVAEQLAELEIISDISPTNDANDVSTFTLPQVAFNMAVGEEVKISEDESTTRYFKISMNNCSVTKIEDDVETDVAFTQDWNNDKSVLAISTNEIFSATSTYKIKVEVSFLEETDGVWEAFKDDDGNEFYETKEVTFTTGEKAEEIPFDLVEYSYPLSKMINFYKDEYNKGYIKFNRGVSDYFDYSNDWSQIVRFTSTSNQISEASLIYNTSTYTVDFSIPDNLVGNEIYSFELVDVPIMEDTSIDRNVESEESDITNSDGTTTTVTTQTIDGEIEEAEENSFVTINFRTSKYNTFAEKIGADSKNIRFLYTVSEGIYLPGATLYRDEMFDKYEIYGDGDLASLVTISADLENADWYQANVDTILYDGYPFHTDATIDYRDTESIGVPPANDIRIWQTYYDKLLTDDEIESGTFVDPTEMSHLIYYIPYYWAYDYQTIRNKLSNIYYGETKPDKVDYILKHPFWPMPSVGNYPINIQYRLPGTNTVTTTKALNLDNDINVEQIDYEYEEDMF